jgi:hypothetical protein
MNLKRVTFLTIIGISYTFILKLLSTFIPNMFAKLITAQITSVLYLLASIIILLFFLSFKRNYIKKEQIKLQQTSVLTIIGACAMIVVNLKFLFLVFDKHSPIYLISTLVKYHFIEAVLPWVSSVCILIFFLTFYYDIQSGAQSKLEKPILFAVIGQSIITLILTFTFGFYLDQGLIKRLSDLSNMIMIILIPTVIFSYLFILYFFLAFYKEQQK